MWPQRARAKAAPANHALYLPVCRCHPSPFLLPPPCCTQVFTNTAAALPCELGNQEIPPGSRAAQQRKPGHAFDWLPMSKYQAAWAQRVVSSKQRQQDQAGGASA